MKEYQLLLASTDGKVEKTVPIAQPIDVIKMANRLFENPQCPFTQEEALSLLGGMLALTQRSMQESRNASMMKFLATLEPVGGEYKQ